MNNDLIAVIAAMECEILKFKSLLKNIEEIKYGQFTFFKGEFYGKNIVIAKSGVGKVAGAICTQIIIDRFNPSLIINTGVAGGLGKDIKVGDIVIAEKLVQHDFDATVLGYAKGYICNGINPKEPTYFYSDKNLTEKIKSIISKETFDLNFHFGTVASGDMFVSNVEKKEEIKKLFGAYAVEMEGAAIAQTAVLNNIPFIVLRAVSDNADSSDIDKYQITESDIAEISANVVQNLIKNI